MALNPNAYENLPVADRVRVNAAILQQFQNANPAFVHRFLQSVHASEARHHAGPYDQEAHLNAAQAVINNMRDYVASNMQVVPPLLDPHMGTAVSISRMNHTFEDIKGAAISGATDASHYAHIASANQAVHDAAPSPMPSLRGHMIINNVESFFRHAESLEAGIGAVRGSTVVGMNDSHDVVPPTVQNQRPPQGRG